MEQIQSDINELHTILNCPSSYLVNYFDDLRNKIDVKCEEYLQIQNNFNSKESVQALEHQVLMVNEVDAFEKICLTNLANQTGDELRSKCVIAIRKTKAEMKNLISGDHKKLKEIRIFIYNALTSVHKDLFINQTIILWTKNDSYRNSADFFDPFLTLKIKSFGLLLIIKDEFINRRKYKK